MLGVSRRFVGVVTAVAWILLAGAPQAGAAEAGAAQAALPNPCAPAPSTTPLAAATSRVGAVDLYFFGAAGAPVSYFECVGQRSYPLGQRSSKPDSATTALLPATFWRCGRLVRRFAATATLADGSALRGTTSVRTMSCANRFRLDVPRSAARRSRVAVRIVDRWKIGGIRLRLCVTSPRGRRSCDEIVLGTTVRSATRHFRATTRGRWRVELRLSGRTTARGTVAVGVRRAALKARPPTVLATGDSTMQGIDSFLVDDIGADARVVSDVRPGFAISKANAWQPVARAQVARLHPTATVISMGANEGFPMRAADGMSHECCDAAWTDEYVRRVRTSMQTYRRAGRARVLWLTIPAPRDARRVPVFAAINAAIVRAAHGLTGVQVVRLDELFTPDGFRDVMRYRGKDIRVRQPDGIHLNVAGTRIAAEVVVQALRAG